MDERGNDEDEYRVEAGVPDAETFLRLRAEAGMHPRSLEGARIGLAHTWHGVVVRHGDETVGMGRIVGDGGTVFQIVDVCLLPAHQRRGLGARIMAALMAELAARAPASAYVSLMADGDAHRLYERFGFAPTAPASIGMFTRT